MYLDYKFSCLLRDIFNAMYAYNTFNKIILFSGNFPFETLRCHHWVFLLVLDPSLVGGTGRLL